MLDIEVIESGLRSGRDVQCRPATNAPVAPGGDEHIQRRAHPTTLQHDAAARRCSTTLGLSAVTAALLVPMTQRKAPGVRAVKGEVALEDSVR
jgi:hypothetical protein